MSCWGLGFTGETPESTIVANTATLMPTTMLVRDNGWRLGARDWRTTVSEGVLWAAFWEPRQSGQSVPGSPAENDRNSRLQRAHVGMQIPSRAVTVLASPGLTHEALLNPRLVLQSPRVSTAGISSATVFAITGALVTSATEATTMALPARM